MSKAFHDRVHAGRLLTRELTWYAGREDVLVLGLPRGGVPVAAEIARQLRVALDVFVVRKLGVPGYEELAMGAIATGGVRVLNAEVVSAFGLDPDTIAAVAAVEERELHRRESAYRGEAAAPFIHGQTVILVDDGMATGATMQAAVAALREQHPARLVVAVPIASPQGCRDLSSSVDELVVLRKPEDFVAVGEGYEDFSPTPDAEVRRLLETAGVITHLVPGSGREM